MNPQIIQEITLLKDFIDQNNDLGIVIGSHQTLDTVASALALYLSLTQAGKKVQIINKKELIVEFSSLVGADRIKASFAGESSDTSKLVISLPYKKGEVEKVLFTEAPNTINFHLTAVPGKSITPFEPSEVRLVWGSGNDGSPEALIVVGVGNIDELAGLIDQNTKIVNMDNFQGNTRFGDIVLVDESFSSLSEISAKIIKDLNLPTDVDVAQNILDGVLSATRNFTKSNTSPLAFEAASAAMYLGAQRKGEEQPRREPQNFGGQRQPQQPQQSQQHQDRGHRDQRSHQTPHQQTRQPRVNENDFPAMHMQGQNQPQQQPRFGGQSQQNQRHNNDRRMNNMPRNMQGMSGGQRPQNPQFSQNRPQRSQNNRPFGQNPNDIEDLMRKIKEENARHMGGGNQFDRGQAIPNSYQDPINEGEIIEEPQMNQPINDNAMPPMNDNMNAPMDDMQMPDEQAYNAPAPEEVPDDWLMPKVFKSSKNNN